MHVMYFHICWFCLIIGLKKHKHTKRKKLKRNLNLSQNKINKSFNLFDDMMQYYYHLDDDQRLRSTVQVINYILHGSANMKGGEGQRAEV